MRDAIHGEELHNALSDEVARRRLVKTLRATDDSDLIASYIGGIRRELTVYRDGRGDVIDWDSFQLFLPLASECLDALSANPNLVVNDVYNLVQVSHLLEQSQNRRFDRTVPVFSAATRERFVRAIESEGVPLSLLLGIADGRTPIEKSLLISRELLRTDPALADDATALCIAELRRRGEQMVGSDLSDLPLEWVIQLADGWN